MKDEPTAPVQAVDTGQRSLFDLVLDDVAA
jgi:hypothetical protein